jgi:hypothetical protein
MNQDIDRKNKQSSKNSIFIKKSVVLNIYNYIFCFRGSGYIE